MTVTPLMKPTEQRIFTERPFSFMELSTLTSLCPRSRISYGTDNALVKIREATQDRVIGEAT